MNRHVIHALRSLLFDYFEHHLGIQVFNPFHARNRFVNGHGADGNGRIAQNGFANFVNIAAGGKIHHRVSAIVHGGVQLFQFFFNFRRDGRVADVGVDLAQRRHTDRHRLELRMVDIGGNNHAAAGNFVTHQLGGQLFAVGNVTHFFRDHTPTGIVHLRKITVVILLLAPGKPVCAGLGSAVTVAAVSVHTVGGSHDRVSLVGYHQRIIPVSWHSSGHKLLRLHFQGAFRRGAASGTLRAHVADRILDMNSGHGGRVGPPESADDAVSG